MTMTGQSTRILADQVWAAYYRSLIRTATGNLDTDKQAVTIAVSAHAADFGNEDAAIAASYIFETGDALRDTDPRSVPPEGLLCSYAAFLDSIDLGQITDPHLRMKLDAARARYQVANRNFSDVRSQAVAAWIEARQADSADFVSFIKDRFPLYTLAANVLRGADIEFEALMFRAYGAEYSAIADARSKCGITDGAATTDRSTSYNMAVKRCIGSMIAADVAGPAEPAMGIGDEPVSAFAPAYKLDGFNAAYSAWQANYSDGIAAETIKLSGNAPAAMYQSPWPPSGGKAPGEFFKIGERGFTLAFGGPVDTRSPHFSVTIGFAGLDTFGIAPGAWFDRGLVEAYRNKTSRTAPRFFGQGGSMGLLMTAVIVGYAPRIIVTMNEADYFSFKARCQALPRPSITIGPFRIGGASDPTFISEGVVFDDRSRAFIVAPRKKPLPLILGVVGTKI